MTSDDRERTSLSGFRFAGAFFGGLLVMGCLPMLVDLLGQGNTAVGYQYTMWLFATLLVILKCVTVLLKYVTVIHALIKVYNCYIHTN